MKKTLRPMGKITDQLEPLLLEMVEEHDMQMGEILNIIRGYLEIHAPSCVEIYEDESSPIFYYGPKDEK